MTILGESFMFIGKDGNMLLKYNNFDNFFVFVSYR